MKEDPFSKGFRESHKRSVMISTHQHQPTPYEPDPTPAPNGSLIGYSIRPLTGRSTATTAIVTLILGIVFFVIGFEFGEKKRMCIKYGYSIKDLLMNVNFYTFNVFLYGQPLCPTPHPTYLMNYQVPNPREFDTLRVESSALLNVFTFQNDIFNILENVFTILFEHFSNAFGL